MKNKKSMFLALLAGLLVLGLAFTGCKNDPEPGGGGSNVFTLKNSTTDLVITGIYIADGTGDGVDIVGTLDNYKAVSIQPGETYTSPEINTSYITWWVETEPYNLFGWAIVSECDWEIYKKEDWTYDQREISDKKFPGGH
jgi:hypothetical protein